MLGTISHHPHVRREDVSRITIHTRGLVQIGAGGGSWEIKGKWRHSTVGRSTVGRKLASTPVSSQCINTHAFLQNAALLLW